KKSLSYYAGAPEAGLADILNGSLTDYHSLIVRNVGDIGLDILPVGTFPPNPAELLSEPAFGELIASLRGEYDYIFLDCPPVELVTDADIISGQADLTIFIVRANLLEKSMLPQIDKFYTTHRFNNLAVVLNGTEPSGRYGYKYGYKYGYGEGKYGNSES
ncbi:MAG: chromosome partitioning protein ParA, partial [Bacteroidales bacterium]|nr:chromosome partitioning protein ParA [Bacteroidales bacterium]